MKFNEYDWNLISSSGANKWEKITLLLKDLGSESDIESFMFQGASIESTIIYFDKIKLVKSDYDDQCAEPEDEGHDSDSPSDSASNIFNISFGFIVNIIMFVLLLN